MKQTRPVLSCRSLVESDIPAILVLYLSNPQYFEHFPPLPSLASIAADMTALPPGKSPADKHYLGYFVGDQLVAVLDWIADYPRSGTAFIGLLMVAMAEQGQGLGSFLVRELLEKLAQDYQTCRLAVVNSNRQAKVFWLKNGFTLTGETKNLSDKEVVFLEKTLDKESPCP